MAGRRDVIGANGSGRKALWEAVGTDGRYLENRIKIRFGLRGSRPRRSSAARIETLRIQSRRICAGPGEIEDGIGSNAGESNPSPSNRSASHREHNEEQAGKRTALVATMVLAANISMIDERNQCTERGTSQSEGANRRFARMRLGRVLFRPYRARSRPFSTL